MLGGGGVDGGIVRPLCTFTISRSGMLAIPATTYVLLWLD